jgi:hypothetical protein
MSLNRPFRHYIVAGLFLFSMGSAPGCAENALEVVASPAIPTPVDSPDLRAMVPAEANLVLSVDMQDLRKSPWTKAAFSEAIGEKESLDGVEQGFAKEVQRLVFAMVPSLGEGASLLVAQGRFSQATLLGMFRNQEGQELRSRYRGMELLERGNQALVIQANQLVLAGPTVVVRAAIDCGQGQARSLDGIGWLESLQKGLSPGPEGKKGKEVASLYVRLADATRKQLIDEIGEGETLEEVGLRLDIGENLVLRSLGRTRTQQEAKDLAARLAQYVRDSQARPIVTAFGFGSVLSQIQFLVKREFMLATLQVSSTDREFIARRMAVVSKTIASIRAGKKSQENQHP